MENTVQQEVNKGKRKRIPLVVFASANNEETKIQTKDSILILTDEPASFYTPPDSKSVYKRLLYTGSHLFLKAYWPKYARIKAKSKESRIKAKLKSNGRKILENC